MQYTDVPGYFDFEQYYTEIANSAPNGSTIIEVGCWLGRSIIYMAEEIAALKKDVRIFGVDTWRGSDDHDANDQVLIKQKHYGYLLHQFLNNVRACGVQSLITPLCMPSVEAARFFEEQSVYMVFIDAQHTYDAVKADIAAWRGKVKPGGFLSGHDYGWAGPEQVKRAVDEAFPKVRLMGRCNSSWMVQL